MDAIIPTPLPSLVQVVELQVQEALANPKHLIEH